MQKTVRESITRTSFSCADLKLADLFDKLGQPDEYWTEIGHGEDREYLEVILLYPTKGYLASVIIDIEGGAHRRLPTVVRLWNDLLPEKIDQEAG